MTIYPANRTRTAIDEAKAAADFRIVGVQRNKWEIRWKDGKFEVVTDRKLEKLQSRCSWHPDF